MRFVVILLLIMLPSHGQIPHCGTALWMRDHKSTNQHLIAKQSVTSAIPCRTLETDHFLIHYVLSGSHRIHTEIKDSLVLQTVDSFCQNGFCNLFQFKYSKYPTSCLC
jgi:hypothetical protein